MAEVDRDRVHNELMAALRGIVNGKGLSERVSYGPLQSARVADALTNAVKYLNEPFHADDLDVANEALETLRLDRISDKKSDVAKQLLDAVKDRRA